VSVIVLYRTVQFFFKRPQTFFIAIASRYFTH
jgi:hypothetical protein